ncbi:MAG: zinc metalloprotease HtpX [Zoogloeaceae bacterium]|jgi:heat shock protein HtpX|nr:zinc metalloprotease HtpX [Zoogloeaceae bacterium]
MYNWLKTALLMAAITALFGALGATLGGMEGMVFALLLGGGMNLFVYWFSDRLVLKMYRAREVDAQSAPDFYRMVRELAQRADLPMPRVYIIDEAQPNAFATGRDPQHAAVAATAGILQTLSARELRGVMAHELAHVQHRDILISTIAATLAGGISAFANLFMFLGGGRGRVHPLAGLLVMLLAPIAAALIQMAISRAREFEADRGGAAISGDADALADALEKIHARARSIPLKTAEAHPETAQMMIMNPLSASSLQNLFSTHPPMAERVARLRALKAQVRSHGFPEPGSRSRMR